LRRVQLEATSSSRRAAAENAQEQQQCRSKAEAGAGGSGSAKRRALSAAQAPARRRTAASLAASVRSAVPSRRVKASSCRHGFCPTASLASRSAARVGAVERPSRMMHAACTRLPLAGSPAPAHWPTLAALASPASHLPHPASDRHSAPPSTASHFEDREVSIGKAEAVMRQTGGHRCGWCG
jgi:hypothetical protein